MTLKHPKNRKRLLVTKISNELKTVANKTARTINTK
jgi:hypothetical protein